MKSLIILMSLLLMLSCKPTSFYPAVEGTWKYGDYFSHYTLALNSDRTFSYTFGVRCSSTGGDYYGSWSYLKNGHILLSFPRIPMEDTVWASAFFPYMLGRNVEVRVMDNTLQIMDRESDSVVLAKVQ